MVGGWVSLLVPGAQDIRPTRIVVELLSSTKDLTKIPEATGGILEGMSFRSLIIIVISAIF